ncbi:ROK family protein [Vibrio furnissii]|uniref:ROK family protein n=1 Tax=Vibrio furnissii TaxID=29494 RepID=UPI001302C378|nr:ROK family protein [Vibrio furnissii]MCG6212764.1 ROK family protein [Vibrio furnissii]
MRIGFDIGGTKTEICVLSSSGDLIWNHRISTPKRYEDFVTAIRELVNLAEQHHGQADAIGLGLPGAISPATGLIKNANCAFLNGRDLQHDLTSQLGRAVNLANDANCFALSEAIDGAGKDAPVVFGAILGTGCGGGLVIHQQLLVGPNAVCGEWGHNPLPGYHEPQDGPARACYCGRHNCIESYISGTGLQHSYQLKTGQTLSAEQIIQAYEQAQPAAVDCYHQLIDHMARSFAALVNILDPDVIVLGGGLSNVRQLYRDLPDATARYVFSDTAQVRFAQAKYGDSSGIRGAAWLGL